MGFPGVSSAGVRGVGDDMVAGACTKKGKRAAVLRHRVCRRQHSAGGSGKKLKVAFVPKLQGSPYFEAMDTGAKQASGASVTSTGSTKGRRRPTPPPRPRSSAPTFSRRSTR